MILTAIHYDPDTTEPISCSMKSLDELLSWKRNEASPFNVATVPLASRYPPLHSCPRRTLVSHDMMGGYLEDRYNSEFNWFSLVVWSAFSIFMVLSFLLRFIQGAEVETPYAFYHWEYIDIFNYFSHQMVSIPPAVWTNAAHKHGVLSIGESLGGILRTCCKKNIFVKKKYAIAYFKKRLILYIIKEYT